MKGKFTFVVMMFVSIDYRFGTCVGDSECQCSSSGGRSFLIYIIVRVTTFVIIPVPHLLFYHYHCFFISLTEQLS